MRYVPTAASTSQAALIVSPRWSAMVPQANAPARPRASQNTGFRRIGEEYRQAGESGKGGRGPFSPSPFLPPVVPSTSHAFAILRVRAPIVLERRSGKRWRRGRERAAAADRRGLPGQGRRHYGWGD